jgi:hypothetical protein
MDEQVPFEFTAEDRAKAIRLLTAEAHKEEHKLRRTEVYRANVLHKAVWQAMRHSDREEFMGLVSDYEANGTISLTTLSNQVLMPGKSSVIVCP